MKKNKQEQFQKEMGRIFKKYGVRPTFVLEFSKYDSIPRLGKLAVWLLDMLGAQMKLRFESTEIVEKTR